MLANPLLNWRDGSGKRFVYLTATGDIKPPQEFHQFRTGQTLLKRERLVINHKRTERIYKKRLTAWGADIL
jgi:hypothetical protein